jgi:hypothetical protein
MTTPEHPVNPASPVSSTGCLGPTPQPDPPEHRASPPGPRGRRPTARAGRPTAGQRPRSRPAGRRTTVRTAAPTATTASPGRVATRSGRSRAARGRPAVAGALTDRPSGRARTPGAGPAPHRPRTADRAPDPSPTRSDPARPTARRAPLPLAPAAPGHVLIMKGPDETSEEFRRRLLDTCPPSQPATLDLLGRLLSRRAPRPSTSGPAR